MEGIPDVGLKMEVLSVVGGASGPFVCVQQGRLDVVVKETAGTSIGMSGRR